MTPGGHINVDMTIKLIVVFFELARVNQFLATWSRILTGGLQPLYYASSLISDDLLCTICIPMTLVLGERHEVEDILEPLDIQADIYFSLATRKAKACGVAAETSVVSHRSNFIGLVYFSCLIIPSTSSYY